MPKVLVPLAGNTGLGKGDVKYFVGPFWLTFGESNVLGLGYP